MSHKLDIFWKDQEGYEGHATLEAEDIETLFANRVKTLDKLTEIGAKPREFGPKYPKPADDRTMEAAAKDAGIAVPQCPNGCGPMRVIPAGVSQRTGKPYRSFTSCSTCGNKK